MPGKADQIPSYILRGARNKKSHEHRKIGCLLALDCENNPRLGIDGFKYAHLYGEVKRDRGKTVRLIDQGFTDVEEFKKFLMDLAPKYTGKISKKTGKPVERNKFRPCTLIAFNLSYDTAFFLDITKTDKLFFSGSRVISSELKNGVKVIDVFNHGGNQSLESWIDYLGMEEKYGIKKTPNPEDMELEALKEHCRWDTMATWHLGEFFKKFYDDLGIGFKPTTAAAAMGLFSSQYFSDWWERPKEHSLNGYERNGYYGGRTECFVRGISDVQSYDVHSMYPSVMHDFPYPRPSSVKKHYGKEGFLKAWNEDVLMIVYCRVFAPPSLRIPVLPYRNKDPVTGAEHILFPVGRFVGFWTSPELKLAVEEGYIIEEVISYLTYSVKKYYFKDFVEDFFRKRQDADNKGLKEALKIILNSLYGKFGQRNKELSFFGNENDFSDYLFDKKIDSQKLREMIDDGGVLVRNYSNGMMSCSSTRKIDSDHTFPCIPAFVCAYARIRLYGMLKKHAETVVYCDTDSVKYPANEPKEPDMHNLGEFGYEPEKSGKFCFLNPKLYAPVESGFEGIPEDYNFLVPYPDDEIIPLALSANFKSKGLPYKRATAILDLKTFEIRGVFDRPLRMKEAAIQKVVFNTWVGVEKVLSILDNKRVWDIGSKDSKPIEFDYYEDVWIDKNAKWLY